MRRDFKALGLLSLSARRAWIEIAYGALDGASEIVALRKESVDRNLAVWAVEHAYQLSLSARRAWIEIETCPSVPQTVKSLSARRAWIEIIGLTYDGLIASGRSPQGERG